MEVVFGVIGLVAAFIIAPIIVVLESRIRRKKDGYSHQIRPTAVGCPDAPGAAEGSATSIIIVSPPIASPVGAAEGSATSITVSGLLLFATWVTNSEATVRDIDFTKYRPSDTTARGGSV